MEVSQKKITTVWFISSGNRDPRKGDDLYLCYDDCEEAYDNLNAEEQANDHDDFGDDWGEYNSPQSSTVFDPTLLVGVKGRMWFDGQKSASSRGEFLDTFDQATLVDVSIVHD
jgi:hypothetical protein